MRRRKEVRQGKLTARRRIYALLDEDSFVELDALAKHHSTSFNLGEKRPLGDSVSRRRYGTIDGRDVCLPAGRRVWRQPWRGVRRENRRSRSSSCVRSSASAVLARSEGVVSLGLYGRIFLNNILASASSRESLWGRRR